MGLYIEVRDNMSEGLRFYMSLQEAIQALQQQSGDFVLTRKLERSDSPDISAVLGVHMSMSHGLKSKVFWNCGRSPHPQVFSCSSHNVLQCRPQLTVPESVIIKCPSQRPDGWIAGHRRSDCLRNGMSSGLGCIHIWDVFHLTAMPGSSPLHPDSGEC